MVSFKRGGNAASSDSGFQRDDIHVARTFESNMAAKTKRIMFNPVSNMSAVYKTKAMVAA